MPVAGGIAEPGLAAFVNLGVLAHRILTYVANSVVVIVNVSRFISAGDVMTAGRSVPVLGFVLGPCLRIVVYVTAVVTADVTASVIVAILVSETLKVFVTDVTLEVLICVYVVFTLYRAPALVTRKILVCVNMLSLGTSELG